MVLDERLPVGLTPASAERLVRELGFLANADLPDRPGPAYLLVAIRPTPTLHHFDPERIEYWATAADGRGVRRELTLDTAVPLERPFEWGRIGVVDRFHITNDFLTFGGELLADRIGETLVAVFSSPAPLLRRGGHSQGWDACADRLGAFFGRVMLAVDYVPGFELAYGASDPVARYAAFVVDMHDEYRRCPTLRDDHPDQWVTISAEARRLQAQDPLAWANGAALLEAMAPAPVA